MSDAASSTLLAGMTIGLFLATVATVFIAVFAIQKLDRDEKRREQFILELIDRFLSRHFEELSMSKMIAGQVEVEQPEPEEDEQEATEVEAWLKRQEELLKQAAAGRGSTSS